MVFEKAKVLKAAEKFLSQGKINAAIKEYRQIVENDEDDLTTLNMLGDLCKAGNGFVVERRAHAQVAQHVERCQIVLVIFNDLTILFDCGVDFSL